MEKKMQAVLRSAAEELGLEAHKTVRLETAAQLGHFLRVTKKVWGERGRVWGERGRVWGERGRVWG